MALEIFTEKELAELLGVSSWTIRNWRIKAGLPYFGTAGRIFYRLEAVEEWMKREESKNSEPNTSKSYEIA